MDLVLDSLPLRVHLDTDFGGDIDDACALAMLLGWPGIEIVGITTTLDAGGYRAGCVNHLLKIAGRLDIPVVAGAGASITTMRRYASTQDDVRYWPETPDPVPVTPGRALELLAYNIKRNATVIAIGAFTNLAMLEIVKPGTLDDATIVMMGGWLHPPDPCLPQWGPDMDFNTQSDTRAAEVLIRSSANLTLVTLPTSLKAQLRACDLERLPVSGPLGRFLAFQCAAFAQDHCMKDLVVAHPGLASDLINFQYDPLACAVAVGWPGVICQDMKIGAFMDSDILRYHQDDVAGRPARVVTDVDGPLFATRWITAIESADHPQLDSLIAIGGRPD